MENIEDFEKIKTFDEAFDYISKLPLEARYDFYLYILDKDKDIFLRNSQIVTQEIIFSDPFKKGQNLILVSNNNPEEKQVIIREMIWNTF